MSKKHDPFTKDLLSPIGSSRCAACHNWITETGEEYDEKENIQAISCCCSSVTFIDGTFDGAHCTDCCPVHSVKSTDAPKPKAMANEPYWRALQALELARMYEKTAMPEYTMAMTQIAMAEALVDIAGTLRDIQADRKKGEY